MALFYTLAAQLASKPKHPVHMYLDILNPQIFLCGFKNFKLNLPVPGPVHRYPTRIHIHSSTQDSSGNIGNRACIVKHAKFASRIMAESTQKLKRNAKIKVDCSMGKSENLGTRLPS